MSEFLVLEELNYDLIVYHSYPMLETLATSANLVESNGNLWYQNCVYLASPPPPRLFSLYYICSCRRIVNDSYLSDVCLRHEPHVVAMACLHIVAHNRQLDLTTWFVGVAIDHEAVWDAVQRILEMYERSDELRNGERVSTATLLARLPLRYKLEKQAATTVQ
jgi:cyclin C